MQIAIRSNNLFVSLFPFRLGGQLLYLSPFLSLLRHHLLLLLLHLLFISTILLVCVCFLRFSIWWANDGFDLYLSQCPSDSGWLSAIRKYKTFKEPQLHNYSSAIFFNGNKL